MTWVGWSELARPATRKKMLAERRAFLEAEIARERDTLAELRRQPPDTPGVKVAVSMVEHVLRQLTLDLDWLDELESVLAR